MLYIFLKLFLLKKWFVFTVFTFLQYFLTLRMILKFMGKALKNLLKSMKSVLIALILKFVEILAHFKEFFNFSKKQYS